MAALATLRRRRLLSQRELARRAGIAPSSVYLIEKGRTVPRLTVMRKILSAQLSDPADVDEFRWALSDQEEAETNESATPDSFSDPVLADLWDNPDDAEYDRLAVPRTRTGAHT